MSSAIVLLLGMLAFSTAQLTNMGPCNVTVQTDGTSSIDKILQENDGIWSMKRIPKNDFSETVEWMFLAATPSNTNGFWSITKYYQEKDGEPKIFIKEEITDAGSGHASVFIEVVQNNVAVKYELKISILKYVENYFLYFYICSEQGVDSSLDHRYVLTHDDLNDDIRNQVQVIEKQYNFAGDMKGI